MKFGLFKKLVRCLLFTYNKKYFETLDRKDNTMGSAKFPVCCIANWKIKSEELRNQQI